MLQDITNFVLGL